MPKYLVEFYPQNVYFTQLADHCNTWQLYFNVLLSCTGLKADIVRPWTAWLTLELQITSLLPINPEGGKKVKLLKSSIVYSFFLCLLLFSDVVTNVNSFVLSCLGNSAACWLIKFIFIMKLRALFRWTPHFCFLFRNSKPLTHILKP